ncbi:PQQ-binding-like beta-propeller repeat protein [Primorskyibacter sp. S187A]|uniref:outer membrane protein assembly factor BamB family protein n=1 Tax=Primorskyibacter sp. S187A TaxID=3415130 RepID=UPI003C7CC936
MGIGSVKLRNLLAVAPLAVLMGCVEPEVILTGEREDIRSDLSTLAPETTAVAFAAPAITNNASWTHGNGSPAYRTDHPALGSALRPLWSVNIGQGDKKRARISADPIVADGRVFTLDSAGLLSAVSTGGAVLWTRELRPERDARNEVSGGGMSYGDGRLYVTTGYGNAHAIDPTNGEEIWVQRLGATGTASPSYDGGLVYLVAGDDVAWAIEADNGRIRWQLEAIEDTNNVFGGPAPAVTDQFVLFGYGNGDVQAAFKKGGLRLWSATVAGRRTGFAINRVSDITGDPVVYGDRVYVGNQSGRLVSLSLGSGQRIWTARHGTVQPVWAAGNALFMISDRNELMRIDRETGAVVWSDKLPQFKSQRPLRRETIFAHHGPVLAGGQLIVASGDGVLRVYDPEDGALTRTVPLPGGATSNPAVAGGVLYVVTRNGQLQAFGG